MKTNCSNMRNYFLKAIAVQRNAFQESYAEKKLNQSCDTLVSSGYCSGCMNCNTCALQMAYEETIAALKNPVEREHRYQAWKKKMEKNNVHTGWNKYGTRVMHCK